MCDEAVDVYGHTLEIVPDCYMARKICNKAVKIYPSTIQFVQECYKNKKNVC